MIGEKIGCVAVKPMRLKNGSLSRCLFDVADAMKKLDENQSYSQVLIAWSAMKGVRPYELNMGAMGWLRDGLERENQALASAGLPTVRVGDLVPSVEA